ncbi:MAG: YdeI/OmpD-associated family protein [Cyclobacteriaceae bacterium]
MPTFFPTPGSFRKWLTENHADETELWVGYYKKATKKSSITWPESVDQALCFGWIDGIRKRIDEEAYMIRFTPRKSNSHWSNVNIARIKELRKDGLVTDAGLKVWKKRNPERTARASYEQKKIVLDPTYETQIRKNDTAAKFFFEKISPTYRKQTIWWVMSAKKEETKLRRLSILIQSSEKGELVPPLRWAK